MQRRKRFHLRNQRPRPARSVRKCRNIGKTEKKKKCHKNSQKKKEKRIYGNMLRFSIYGEYIWYYFVIYGEETWAYGVYVALHVLVGVPCHIVVFAVPFHVMSYVNRRYTAMTSDPEGSPSPRPVTPRPDASRRRSAPSHSTVPAFPSPLPHLPCSMRCCSAMKA